MEEFSFRSILDGYEAIYVTIANSAEKHVLTFDLLDDLIPFFRLNWNKKQGSEIIQMTSQTRRFSNITSFHKHKPSHLKSSSSLTSRALTVRILPGPGLEFRLRSQFGRSRSRSRKGPVLVPSKPEPKLTGPVPDFLEPNSAPAPPPIPGPWYTLLRSHFPIQTNVFHPRYFHWENILMPKFFLLLTQTCRSYMVGIKNILQSLKPVFKLNVLPMDLPTFHKVLLTKYREEKIRPGSIFSRYQMIALKLFCIFSMF
jgi:hypothetical protein